MQNSQSNGQLCTSAKNFLLITRHLQKFDQTFFHLPPLFFAQKRRENIRKFLQPNNFPAKPRSADPFAWRIRGRRQPVENGGSILQSSPQYFKIGSKQIVFPFGGFEMNHSTEARRKRL